MSVAGVEVEFARGSRRPPPPEVLKALDEWAGSESRRLVVVLDEAQELYKLKGGSLTPVLAWAYDNLKNLAFLLTGSKAGLMHRLLKLEDPESPLYGRRVQVVRLGSSRGRRPWSSCPEASRRPAWSTAPRCSNAPWTASAAS